MPNPESVIGYMRMRKAKRLEEKRLEEKRLKQLGELGKKKIVVGKCPEFVEAGTDKFMKVARAGGAAGVTTVIRRG